MADTSESSKSARERLKQTIPSLELQRAILGDETTDAAIAAPRRELSALDETDTNLGHQKAV